MKWNKNNNNNNNNNNNSKRYKTTAEEQKKVERNQKKYKEFTSWLHAVVNVATLRQTYKRVKLLILFRCFTKRSVQKEKHFKENQCEKKRNQNKNRT